MSQIPERSYVAISTYTVLTIKKKESYPLYFKNIFSAVLILSTSLFALYAAVMLCAPAQEEIKKSINYLDLGDLTSDIESVPKEFNDLKTLLESIQDDIMTKLKGTSDEFVFQENSAKILDIPGGPIPEIDSNNGIAKMNDYIVTVETYRYWGSIGLFAFYGVTAILSKFGVCFKSKVN